MLYNHVNPKGDKQVTFTEYLKTARDGDKNAYGMLCNDSADGLYAIAYLTLNTSEDAEEAVRGAFSDGFSAINRIKDRGHLRAWLARELTKHIVNRLKQYRAEGEPTPEDTDARRIFSQLSGLDRLVCSLSLTYGYDSHEISIITGLTEEAVARKLEISDKKLGAQKAAVSRCIMGCKAPESLYTTEKPRLIPFNPPPYVTQTIDINNEATETPSTAKKIEFSDISEKPHPAQEQMSATTHETPAETEISAENKAEKIEFSDISEKTQPVQEQANTTTHETPAEAEIPTENKAEKIEFSDISEKPQSVWEQASAETHETPAEAEIPTENKAEKIEFSDISEKPQSPQEQTSAATHETPADAEIPAENKAEKIEFSDISEKPHPAQEQMSATTHETPAEAEIPAENKAQSPQEQASAEKHSSPREIDARMFIGIISAQHIKGGEFLQLMGNTRISNSAYREIEQNPNLTKERLITLLEELGLTTADYYKLLTAVKQRNGHIAHENDSDTRSFTPEESAELQKKENETVRAAAQPVPTRANAEKSEKPEEVRPAKPRVIEPEDKPSESVPKENADPLSVTTILGSLGKEPEEILPAKPRVIEPEDKPSESVPKGNADPLSVTTILGSLGKEPEEVRPAKPRVIEPEDKPSESVPKENADPLSVTTILGSLGKEPEEVRPAKPRVIEPEDKPSESVPEKKAAEEPPEQPYRPDFDASSIALTTEIDEPIMPDEPVAPAKPKVLAPPEPPRVENPLVTEINENEEREKYKSNEFFYDDNAYEAGINNGKIIFCAVCAVLLIAGSFGIRYARTGSFIPTEKPAVSTDSPENSAEIDPSAIVTDDDVKAAVNKLTLREQKNNLDEYYSGGAYENPLKNDVIEIGDVMYLYSKNTLRAVELNEENPALIGEAELSENGDFIGFTANEKYVYAISETAQTETERKGVTVEIYDEKLNLLNTYKQDGSYDDILVGNETLTLFTSLNTFGEENALPTYEFNGKSCILTREDIEIPENIAYNSFSVFGTISADEVRAQAVLGGYDSYAITSRDSFTLLIPDFNKTYALKYRIIGLNAELQSQESFDGECFGKNCADSSGNIFVTYDSAAGCTKIQKKINGEYVSIGSLGAGERLSGVSFSGDLVYIVTTSANGAATLYCGDTSGSALAEITPDPDAVYTRRLSGYKNDLIGLSAIAGENGERTGLRLNVYGYDGKLEELYGTDITVDEKTAPEYARYLSGDAEKNSSLIAVGDGYVAVSCVYFDGVSEIERFLCFKDTGESFETAADIMLFDIQSDYRCLSIRNEILYIVTDSTIVTVDIESGNATGYFPYEK